MTHTKTQAKTDVAVPDGAVDKVVEEVADGGEGVERERLLLLVHLHVVKDAAWCAWKPVTIIIRIRIKKKKIIIKK